MKMIHLNSIKPWVDKEGFTCRLRAGKKMTLAEVKGIESTTHFKLPQDYIEIVTRQGLWGIERTSGRKEILGQMLTAKQIVKIYKKFQKWIAPDEFGDEEEDLEAAAREQALRSKLIPFQYCVDGSATDVNCFVAGKERNKEPRIIGAFHDDYEISEWIDDEDMVGADSFGFGRHLRNWLKEAGFKGKV